MSRECSNNAFAFAASSKGRTVIVMKPLLVSLRFSMASAAMFLGLFSKNTVAAETKSDPVDNRAGKNFIATRVFSAEDDAKVLKAFEGFAKKA